VRRDIEVIKAVLVEIADSPHNHFEAPLPVSGAILVNPNETSTGASNMIKAEHMRWMLDAGWLEKLGGRHVRVTSLGMDFLESIENEGVWRETKKRIAAEGGSFALEIVRKVAMGIAKEKLEKHAGLEW
jgi:hypothetical protein